MERFPVRKLTAAAAYSCACFTLLSSAGCFFGFTNPAEDLEPGQIAGRVVAGSEAEPNASVPFADARVSLPEMGFSQRSAVDGEFLFAGLPGGNYVLLVEASSGADPEIFDLKTRRIIELPNNDGLRVGDVRLEPTGDIEGVVRRMGVPNDENAGIRVLLAADQRVAVSDANGDVALPRVAAGDYELVVAADGFKLERINVTVTPGATASFDAVTLVPAEGQSLATVGGQVLLDSRRSEPDHSGTLVRLRNNEGTIIAAADLTEADGSYRMNDVPEGVYIFEAVHEGFLPVVRPNIPVSGGTINQGLNSDSVKQAQVDDELIAELPTFYMRLGDTNDCEGDGLEDSADDDDDNDGFSDAQESPECLCNPAGFRTDALGFCYPEVVTEDDAGRNAVPLARIAPLPSQIVPVGVELSFDASPSSDADDAIEDLTFFWTINLPDGRRRGIDGGVTAPFTPTEAGEYRVNLLVSDGKASSLTVSRPFTAEVQDQPPVPLLVVTDPDGVVYEDGRVRAQDVIWLDGSGTADPDTDAADLSFSFTLTPPDFELAPPSEDSPSSIVAFTPTTPGTYMATLTVADSINSVDTSVAIEVLEADLPPVVSILSPTEDAQLEAGIPVVLEGEATDNVDTSFPDEAFRWLEGDIEVATGPMTTAELRAGVHTLRLEVSDTRGQIGDAEVTFQVGEPAEDAPLRVESDEDEGGLVGEALPGGVVVRVIDDFGNPRPDVAVLWEVLEGGGSLDNSSASSDAEGLVSSDWTLGTVPGPQVVRVGIDDGEGGFTDEVQIRATAVVGPPQHILLLAGNNQVAPVDSILAESIVVAVTDNFENPVPNVDLGVTLEPGGGIIDPPDGHRTDENGQLALTWRLGTGAATYSLSIVLPGRGDVTVMGTAVPGPPAEIVLNGGGNQTGTVGQTLAQPIVVAITDRFGNPIQGETLEFSILSDGGGLEPGGPYVSDVDGSVAVNWELAIRAGQQTLQVSHEEAQGITVQATAAPDDPSSISGFPDGVDVEPNSEAPVTVRVLDRFSNLVPDVPVRFTLNNEPDPTAGFTTPADVTTNASGQASVTLRVNLVPGVFDVTATVVGEDLSPASIEVELHDSDRDGISDFMEDLYGTFNNNDDSDGDGLTDIEENPNRNGTQDEGETHANNPDTDGDALQDGLEAGGPTDPLDADSDDDGLLDGAEDIDRDGEVDDNESNPLLPDTDGDGLCDAGLNDNEGDGPDVPTGGCTGSEQELGTFPWDRDSDDDGLEDPEEDNDGGCTPGDRSTDPLDPDSDDDGLLDGVENCTGTFVDLTATGTDPKNEDSDGDQVRDDHELRQRPSGTFGPEQNALIDGTPHTLFLADADGTGGDDLILWASDEEQDFSRYEARIADGAGGFTDGWSRQDYNFYSQFLRGEFTGDDEADYLAFVPGSSAFALFLGQEGQPPVENPFPISNLISSVLVVDLNDDGADDFIVNYSDTNQHSYFVNCHGTPLPEGCNAAPPAGALGLSQSFFLLDVIADAMVAADLNLDGDLDLIFADGETGDIHYSPFVEDGGFQILEFAFALHKHSGAQNYRYELATADLNHDGLEDLIIGASGSTSFVSVALGERFGVQGLGRFGPLVDVARTQNAGVITGLFVEDIDGDQVHDIIAGIDRDIVYIRGEGNFRRGTGRFRAPVVIDSVNEVDLARGDFDADGQRDLIGIGPARLRYRAWRGLPGGFTTDPNNVDTDGDGLCDGSFVHATCVGAELAVGTAPLEADTDFDGLNDAAELTGPSDPFVPDSDGDGLLDGEEDARGGDPDNPLSPAWGFTQVWSPENVLTLRNNTGLEGGSFAFLPASDTTDGILLSTQPRSEGPLPIAGFVSEDGGRSYAEIDFEEDSLGDGAQRSVFLADAHNGRVYRFWTRVNFVAQGATEIYGQSLRRDDQSDDSGSLIADIGFVNPSLDAASGGGRIAVATYSGAQPQSAEVHVLDHNLNVLVNDVVPFSFSVDGDPVVAVNAAGEVAVVTPSFNQGEQIVQMACLDPDTAQWSVPLRVTDQVTLGNSPEIAALPNGRWVIAFAASNTDAPGDENVEAVEIRRDCTGAFGAPHPVTSVQNGGAIRGLALAATPGGTVTAAWRRGANDGELRLARSVDPDAGWGPTIRSSLVVPTPDFDIVMRGDREGRLAILSDWIDIEEDSDFTRSSMAFLMAAADSDGDGLPDFIEDDGQQVVDFRRVGSSPSLVDTDSDGLDDPEELVLGTNPALGDTDSDGLIDPLEFRQSQCAFEPPRELLPEYDPFDFGEQPPFKPQKGSSGADGSAPQRNPLIAIGDFDGNGDPDFVRFEPEFIDGPPIPRFLRYGGAIEGDTEELEFRSLVGQSLVGWVSYDANGDGRDDLVTVDSDGESSNVQLWLSCDGTGTLNGCSGSATLTAADVANVFDVRAVTAGNVDGDPALEVVTYGGEGQVTRVDFDPNDPGAGRITSEIGNLPDTNELYVRDLNADGINDIVGRNFDSVYVLPGCGADAPPAGCTAGSGVSDGDFGTLVTLPFIVGPQNAFVSSVGIANMDSDGIPDLLIHIGGDGAPNEVHVYLQRARDGRGLLRFGDEPHHTLTNGLGFSGYGAITVADLNEDGATDLLFGGNLYEGTLAGGLPDGRFANDPIFLTLSQWRYEALVLPSDGRTHLIAWGQDFSVHHVAPTPCVVAVTNPNNEDSDGDGILDGDEVNNRGTRPDAPDSDGDGISDSDEIAGGTATDPWAFPEGFEADTATWVPYADAVGGLLSATSSIDANRDFARYELGPVRAGQFLDFSSDDPDMRFELVLLPNETLYASGVGSMSALVLTPEDNQSFALYVEPATPIASSRVVTTTLDITRYGLLDENDEGVCPCPAGSLRFAVEEFPAIHPGPLFVQGGAGVDGITLNAPLTPAATYPLTIDGSGGLRMAQAAAGEGWFEINQSDVTIQGWRFERATELTNNSSVARVDQGAADFQFLDNEVEILVLGSVIRLEDAVRARIAGNRIQLTTGNALSFDDVSRNAVVEDNVLVLAAESSFLDGTNHSFRRNRVIVPNGGDIAIFTLAGGGWTVANNDFIGTGIAIFESAALVGPGNSFMHDQGTQLQVDGAGTRVFENDFQQLEGASGFFANVVFGSNSAGSVLARNRIRAADNIGVRLSAPGIQVLGNYFTAGQGTHIQLSGAPNHNGTILAFNTLAWNGAGNQRPTGIAVDDVEVASATSFPDVDNSLLIAHNTLWETRGALIVGSDDSAGIDLRNNIFVQTLDAGRSALFAFGASNYVSGSSFAGSNLVYRTGGQIPACVGPGCSDLGLDAVGAPLDGDPLLLDPANANFSLEAASPALDAADADGDIQGRITGPEVLQDFALGAADIGAWQDSHLALPTDGLPFGANAARVTLNRRRVYTGATNTLRFELALPTVAGEATPSRWRIDWPASGELRAPAPGDCVGVSADFGGTDCAALSFDATGINIPVSPGDQGSTSKVLVDLNVEVLGGAETGDAITFGSSLHGDCAGCDYDFLRAADWRRGLSVTVTEGTPAGIFAGDARATSGNTDVGSTTVFGLTPGATGTNAAAGLFAQLNRADANFATRIVREIGTSQFEIAGRGPVSTVGGSIFAVADPDGIAVLRRFSSQTPNLTHLFFDGDQTLFFVDGDDIRQYFDPNGTVNLVSNHASIGDCAPAEGLLSIVWTSDVHKFTEGIEELGNEGFLMLCDAVEIGATLNAVSALDPAPISRGLFFSNDVLGSSFHAGELSPVYLANFEGGRTPNDFAILARDENDARWYLSLGNGLDNRLARSAGARIEGLNAGDSVTDFTWHPQAGLWFVVFNRGGATYLSTINAAGVLGPLTRTSSFVDDAPIAISPAPTSDRQVSDDYKGEGVRNPIRLYMAVDRAGGHDEILLLSVPRR